MLLLNFSKTFLNILFGANDSLSIWYLVVETVKTPPLFFLLLTANAFTLSLSAAATLVTTVIKALSEFPNFRLCLISLCKQGLAIPLSRVLKNDCCKMLGLHVISTHCLGVIMTFCVISKQPIASEESSQNIFFWSVTEVLLKFHVYCKQQSNLQFLRYPMAMYKCCNTVVICCNLFPLLSWFP